MNKKLNELAVRSASAVVMALVFFGTYWFSVYTFNLFLFLLLGWILRFEWPKLCPFKGIKGILFTLIYPIIPLGMLLHLHNYGRELNFWLPLFPFFIAISYDTVAYLTGTWLGKHRICPSISPQKSWEGLFGGFLAVFALLPWLLHKKVSFLLLHDIKFLAAAIILTLAAFGGDLFESWLKRRANVKDTANLLPGHGGILDRIDAVLGVMLVFHLFW